MSSNFLVVIFRNLYDRLCNEVRADFTNALQGWFDANSINHHFKVNSVSALVANGSVNTALSNALLIIAKSP